MAAKNKKYLIQFQWADPYEPSNSNKNRWKNWKEIREGNDKKAFKKAEKEFNEKRNWVSRQSLLSFRVCRILKKKDCIYQD
jgi:hypothetical protein